MQEIKKQKQPNSLAEYKKSLDASYDNLPKNVRGAIKNALLKEQGCLCAYCMGRISFNKMRIEHWACQDNNPNLQLEYTNLLACCQGNEGLGQNREI